MNFLFLHKFVNLFPTKDTAQRHIPKCKNIFNRPKPPKGSSAENNSRPPVQPGKKSPMANKNQSKNPENKTMPPHLNKYTTLYKSDFITLKNHKHIK